jgi:hypothetical protein
VRRQDRQNEPGGINEYQQQEHAGRFVSPSGQTAAFSKWYL